MTKDILNTFINKYSLNGTIESVKWNVCNKDRYIATSSMSDDRGVLCFVTLKDNADLDDMEIGVNDTSKLKKMLTVLGDDITIVPNKTTINSVDPTGNPLAIDRIVSLTIVSGEIEVQYCTADLSIIPSVPPLKKLPVFDLEIILTKDFISTFIRAKSALSDDDNLTLSVDKKGKIKMTLGYSVNNSNRINIAITPVDNKNKLTKTLHFNAKYLKEILVSNIDCENAVWKISEAGSGGLSHIEFNDSNSIFSSNYYLVGINKID
jgi:hypothetical protein